MSPELQARIADRIAKSFKRFARRGGAGPGGGRFEHWECIALDEEISRVVSKTLVRLATGDMPREALRAALAARLVGIPKSSGGIRVLGCGGVIRRTVAKAVAKEMQRALKESVGCQQFGLQEDGTGRLHKMLSAMAAMRPHETVIMSLDIADAFSYISREEVIRAV